MELELELCIQMYFSLVLTSTIAVCGRSISIGRGIEPPKNALARSSPNDKRKLNLPLSSFYHFLFINFTQFFCLN